MTDPDAGASQEATAAVFRGAGEMAARCRAFDWASTPLGPVARWPAALRTVAGLVLAAPTGMIVLWGPELVQLYNDAYRTVMGAKHPAGLGQPTRDCWPEVWAFNAPLYAGVLERGEAFTFTDQRLVVERHGRPEEAFFTLTFSPVPGDGGDGAAGAVGGVLVTVFETTAQVRARDARALERERLLEESEAARRDAERRSAELAAVIESMPDAVYIGSAAGITLANQAALDQLGFATHEELNRGISTLAEEIQTRDAETGVFIREEHQAFARALGGERVVQDVRVRHRTTGEDRVVRCAAAPVTVEGRVIAAVAVNTDVTGQVRARHEVEGLLAAERAARSEAESAYAQAQSAYAEAAAASQAKSQFLANMSHELRTPLNAIGGYVQLLEMELHGPVTDAQRTALGRVQRAQHRLLALINDVLNYAKLEGGRVAYDVRIVDVREVITDVAPLVEPQLTAKGLVFDVALPDGPCVVWADREKLGQVLLNLLSNATKFTPARDPASGAPGRVTVHLGTRAAAGDAVFLRVTDTGRGVPRDKQDAIFDPFVQVRTGYAHGTEGTGLGLAISRDLARGMGGDLRVRSVEGEGATFTVTLRRVGGGAPKDPPA